MTRMTTNATGLALAGLLLAATASAGPPPAAGGDEIPPAAAPARAAAGAAAEPLAAVRKTAVFFTPSDNDATATVVSLYNTTAAPRSVVVKGFNSAGALTVLNTVDLPPRALVRLISDPLPTPPPDPPPSWQNAVLTNWTDFTTYARLAVPSGVKVDGYVVVNPGTQTIDPRADQGAIPLRFSTRQP